MPEPSPLGTLCDDVFPAMLAANPAMPRAVVLRVLVRRIAGRVAAARGLSLPGADAAALRDLPIGADDITLPGEVYGLLADGRHEQGTYYTPPALARQVSAWTLAPLLAGRTESPTVLDPAMGGGHFLAAAGEMIARALGLPRWQVAQGLYGLDSDPAAVELARLTLWLWAAEPGTSPGDFAGQLVCADALLDPLPGSFPARFEAVVGNPPYASVFTRAQNEDGRREALQARYQTAKGSFDLAVPFVERAATLCAPGGRVGLIVPNKLLAASYAHDLRCWLGERVTVDVLADYSTAPAFDADVYPVAVVLEKHTPQANAPLTVYRADGGLDEPSLLRRGSQADLRPPGGDYAVWSAALDPAWGALHACFDGTVPLGEVAELASGLTVGEAYDLRDRVIDAAPGMLPADAMQLLTTGLIVRHRALWGCKDVRYLKRQYRRPVIMASALPPRRREQARSHKLIVAGLGLRPRVVLDRGLAQAAVSTTIITDAEWPLGALCAVLNSALLARLYRALFGGLALGGGYLRFAQRELALLPLPDVPADDPRVARLDALACQLYGVDSGKLE